MLIYQQYGELLFFTKMPKKLKERIFRYFFLQNTEKENEELKKELTEVLKEIVLKKGFVIFEVLLFLLIVSIILNIVQYFLNR